MYEWEYFGILKQNTGIPWAIIMIYLLLFLPVKKLIFSLTGKLRGVETMTKYWYKLSTHEHCQILALYPLK